MHFLLYLLSNMITDQDIKKLKGIFATKEDLKKFATKQDLERFATKKDLKRFATKDELQDLAGGLREDMRALHSEVLTRMDTVFKEVKEMREEQTMHLAQHDRINQRLDAIEQVPTIAHHLNKNLASREP